MDSINSTFFDVFNSPLSLQFTLQRKARTRVLDRERGSASSSFRVSHIHVNALRLPNMPTRSFLSRQLDRLFGVRAAPTFLRYGFYLTSLLALASLARIALTTMGFPQPATKPSAPAPAPEPRKRRMVHLKTKEECRLGNETIQVWSVELPSRHAEGILKSARPPVTPGNHAR